MIKIKIGHFLTLKSKICSIILHKLHVIIRCVELHKKKKNLDIHMTRDQMPPKTILSCWFSKDFLKKNIWLFFSKIRQSKPTSNWTYTKRSVTFSCYLQGIVVLHTTPYLPIHRILLLTRKRIARTVNQ